MKKPRPQRGKSASRTKPDRATRLARVTALAEQTFGDKAKADRWLRKPKRALEGATPLTCLLDEAGARQVEEMLHSIDSGIFV